MEIRIPLERDTYNTYPNDKLLVNLGSRTDDYLVSLQIEGQDRLVEVDGRLLFRALYALYGANILNQDRDLD